jgi:AraC-like DNA-binding protein
MGAEIFDDHRFCAGRTLDVAVMAKPHSHSQVEINLVIEGRMLYRFGGDTIPVERGSLVLFWGARAHQVIEKAAVTRFVVIYLPVSAVLAVPLSGALRAALFAGGVIGASRLLPGEVDTFLRWREDLLAGDGRLEAVVKDEVGARLRRIDIDGWSDLRPPEARAAIGHVGQDASEKVERIARFLDEHAQEEVRAEHVGRVVGLHPNYAMALFKRSLGLTMNQYLTRRRLDDAQDRLVTGEQDVAAIAFECGFGSLSRFYEAFRARYGLSPAEFRRRYRRLAS